MTCLIVDDSKIARTTMNHLAKQIADLVVVSECADAMEAYNFLQTTPVDLLLLDIEMPGMSGIELIKNITSNKPVIIFTTSKRDYAVEAFELNVADYLVKPVIPARFISAIDKARELIESAKLELRQTDEGFIFIRDSNIVRKLNLDEILYAEAMGDYVKIHTALKFFAVHNTLKVVEERLPANKFIRVHRSFIVALDKIETIKDGSLIINSKPIPVADAYRALVNKRMNII